MRLGEEFASEASFFAPQLACSHRFETLALPQMDTSMAQFHHWDGSFDTNHSPLSSIHIRTHASSTRSFQAAFPQRAA